MIHPMANLSWSTSLPFWVPDGVACFALTMGFVIESRWGSEGETLLKPDRLHNKRLHADATALSTDLLAVASRLRWPYAVGQSGAGEPQSVIQAEKCRRDDRTGDRGAKTPKGFHPEAQDKRSAVLGCGAATCTSFSPPKIGSHSCKIETFDP